MKTVMSLLQTFRTLPTTFRSPLDFRLPIRTYADALTRSPLLSVTAVAVLGLLLSLIIQSDLLLSVSIAALFIIAGVFAALEGWQTRQAHAAQGKLLFVERRRFNAILGGALMSLGGASIGLGAIVLLAM
jgi:hypothetical protein